MLNYILDCTTEHIGEYNTDGLDKSPPVSNTNGTEALHFCQLKITKSGKTNSNFFSSFF